MLVNEDLLNLYLVYDSKIIKADLDASTATIDQVPTADGEGGWNWADQASAISSLKDVQITNLKNNQILAWNTASQKWTNQNQTGGGEAPSEIPIATNETLGGIKVGNYLNITDEGVLSAVVDEELSAESKNPIAASAVYNALNNLIVLDEEEF